MGREIKRLPLDFDWPLSKTWDGFLNPHYVHRKDCPFCDGSGHNPETKQLADDWYDLDGIDQRWWYAYGIAPDGTQAERPPWKIMGECRRWCYSITQDEVDALVEAGRLYDFTRHFVSGEGWVVNDPPTHPTAEQVNAWAPHGFGHDAINRWICVETRAKRLGVYGKCKHCDGSGELWRSPEDEAACDEWTETKPPDGPGWQMWETVSEGSPVSPVFDTPEGLADWMVNGATNRFDRASSIEAAMAFITAGWAPSFVGVGKTLVSGVESASLG